MRNIYSILEETIRKKGKHKENTRYSKYKLEMKQTLAYVQVMSNMRQTSVKHEIVIIIEDVYQRMKNSG